MLKSSKNIFLSAIAWIFLGLAIAGIFLPLLPTTPFVLVSVYLFSRSNPRIHKRIIESKHLGPVVSKWEERGVIPLKAKVLATSMMIPLVGYALIFSTIHIAIKVMAALSVVWALAFIWPRPSK